jgi:hypothetical protein
MTDRLETLIHDVLAGKATEAANGAGLEGAARQRGHRLILRRRITAGVACVAALAAGIPSGVWLFGTGGGGRGVGPAGSIYGPAVRPSLPPKLTKITLGDVSKLPQGAPPAIPYFADGRLHNGEQEIGLTRRSDDAIFTPVYGGYLVQVTNNDVDADPFNRVMLVDAAGNKVRDLPLINEHAPHALPAVSADGRTIAWPEWTASGSGSKLVVGDSATGKVLHSKVIADVPFPYPVGFVGQKVVFAAGLPAETDLAFGKAVKDLGSGVTGIWDPASGGISAIDEAGAARGVDDFEHILTGTNPAQTCPAVYDATTNRRLWRTCGMEFSKLSRSGVVIGEEDVFEPDKTRTVILDAVTGRRLLEIKGSYSEAIAWEQGDDFLLVAGDGQGAVIVRCSLAGHCERATEPLPGINISVLPDKP